MLAILFQSSMFVKFIFETREFQVFEKVKKHIFPSQSARLIFTLFHQPTFQIAILNHKNYFSNSSSKQVQNLSGGELQRVALTLCLGKVIFLLFVRFYQQIG